MNVIETIRGYAGYVTVEDIVFQTELIVCLTGVLLFGGWLLKTSLGRKALADSVPRRNNMPVYLPFIVFFIWYGSVPLAVLTVEILAVNLQDWQVAFLDNCVLCVGGLTVIAIIIFLARAHFVRRLKGFGLDVKTIHKDFFAAFVNLLSVWPLLLAMIILTMFFGKLIWGQDFQLQQHEELKLISAHPQLPLRILIVVLAVAIAPVFEEMLFRGLFQTMVRSLWLRHPAAALDEQSTGRMPVPRSGAWLAILISSILFAIIHANTGHWPALFMLGLCLGYAYEKSGSLFRPIFIHSLFNTVSIVAALNQ